jgi:hypothetical protein
MAAGFATKSSYHYRNAVKSFRKALKSILQLISGGKKKK